MAVDCAAPCIRVMCVCRLLGDVPFCEVTSDDTCSCFHFFYHGYQFLFNLARRFVGAHNRESLPIPFELALFRSVVIIPPQPRVLIKVRPVASSAMLRSLRTQWRQISRSLCNSLSDAQPARTLPGFSGEFRPCGVLARKVGMMSLWDAQGTRHPITVLCVDRCHVISVAPPNPNDHRQRWRIQVGAGPKRPYKTNKAHRYHCAKAGVEPKYELAEFGVHEMFKLDVGTEIRANHFSVGQLVDVTGTSIGKGTQGVMKRWGFSGAPASHGTSKTHRKGGSIGMSTKPGRVFKGKKMAGRMGNERVTVHNLMVYRVDCSRNLIYVRGAVPGNSGNWVRVRDAVKKLRRNDEAPPALRVSTDGILEWRKKGVVEAVE